MSKALTRVYTTLAPELDLEDICSFVSDGGTVAAYCSNNRLSYRHVRGWFKENEHRTSKLTDARSARDELRAQYLMSMVTEIASFDPSQIFDDAGNMLPVQQWPQSARAALGAYETDKLGQPKVKFVNRLDAAKMAGRELGIFKEKVTVEGKLTLADLVSQAGSHRETKSDE